MVVMLFDFHYVQVDNQKKERKKDDSNVVTNVDVRRCFILIQSKFICHPKMSITGIGRPLKTIANILNMCIQAD